MLLLTTDMLLLAHPNLDALMAEFGLTRTRGPRGGRATPAIT